jgi:hypothetical protein
MTKERCGALFLSRITESCHSREGGNPVVLYDFFCNQYPN